MIVGTAGHVDHGKTALVQALTGVDTDRLKVEKERSITTELGFAPLELDSGVELSIVDVPGHERFVGSMAAGAAGVDLALLVVALDEGVMPQTREHIDICALLGVRAGILVLSKLDVATDESARQVEAEVRTAAQGTLFASAPAVCVSSRTGAGLRPLREAIGMAIAKLASPPTDGLFFMGVDRAFTLKGFGTVVTGTVSSGAVSCDEELVLLPSSLGSHRVRGLHRQGRPVREVRAGERAAINLSGVEVGAISRGMVVARPNTLRLSQRADVEVRCLPSSLPLGPRDAFVVHVGTASAASRLQLLGEPTLRPGSVGLAQLVLERPLPLLAGQRFLLRGFRGLAGQGRTVGGGRVLQIEAPRRRPRGTQPVEALRFEDLTLRIATLAQRPGGTTREGLMQVAGVGQQALDRTLELLVQQKVLRQEVDQWRAASAPSAAPAPAEPPRPRDLTPLECAVLAELARGELAPPTLPQLILRLRLDGGDAVALTKALDRLCALGKAVRAAEGMFFDAECIQSLRLRLLGHLRSQGSVSVADFKALTGGSRRFSIPLSELFDKERLTLRVGDKRVLREGDRLRSADRTR